MWSTKRVLQLIVYWSSIFRTFKNLAKYLILKVHKYVYLDIDRYFSTKISYIPRRGSGNGMPSDVPLPLWVALTNTTRPQWKATLKEMEKIWKIIIGCTLLLIPYVQEALSILWTSMTEVQTINCSPTDRHGAHHTMGPNACFNNIYYRRSWNAIWCSVSDRR